ncbi:MAG TPA: hypothetical protein VH540_25665 [Ktedonobacterales bacterium]|jgi:hypothetical protein
MAWMWFRCPVCGTMMQGDPRSPPVCPNSANHPVLPPGQLPQQFSLGRAPESAWARFRRLPRGKQGAIGLLAFVVLFFGVGLAISPLLSIIASFAPAGATTPTPASPIVEATFGGTLSAFQAAYGPSQAGTGATREWSITISRKGFFEKALVAVTLAQTPSSDGQQHIMAMTIGPDGGVWSQDIADEILPMFLPNDAQSQQYQQVQGVGLADVYISAGLGATFPASDFAARPGGLAPPGTFWTFFDDTKAGTYTLMLGD